jgi:hypothetical protein
LLKKKKKDSGSSVAFIQLSIFPHTLSRFRPDKALRGLNIEFSPLGHPSGLGYEKYFSSWRLFVVKTLFVVLCFEVIIQNIVWITFSF